MKAFIVLLGFIFSSVTQNGIVPTMAVALPPAWKFMVMNPLLPAAAPAGGAAPGAAGAAGVAPAGVFPPFFGGLYPGLWNPFAMSSMFMPADSGASGASNETTDGGSALMSALMARDKAKADLKATKTLETTKLAELLNTLLTATTAATPAAADGTSSAETADSPTTVSPSALADLLKQLLASKKKA